MTTSKKINLRTLSVVTAFAIALTFGSCSSHNSDGQIQQLESAVTTLKENVSSLQTNLDQMKGKNIALESEIQTLRNEVNSLKITAH